MLESLIEKGIVLSVFQANGLTYFCYICSNCDKERVRRLTNEHIKPRDHVFCSTACSGKFKSKNRTLQDQLAGVYRYARN